MDNVTNKEGTAEFKNKFYLSYQNGRRVAACAGQAKGRKRKKTDRFLLPDGSENKALLFQLLLQDVGEDARYKTLQVDGQCFA